MRTLETHVMTISDLKEAIQGLAGDAIVWVNNERGTRVGVVTSHDTEMVTIDDCNTQEPGLSLHYKEV